LLGRIPWPLVVLFVGIVLAAQAVVLGALQSTLSKWAFLLAAITILAGLGWLAVKYLRERRQPPPLSDEHKPLQVYRHQSCRINRPLVDRMAGAEAALTRWVQNKNGQVDWDANGRRREEAEAALKRGDLPVAFREYCRAVQPLIEVVLRDRSREEALQPFWEKTPG
jgi:hypothetical protein